MTTENDIVLVHFEDSPLVFARIEQILPDAKPGWYHVRLLLLQLPLQTVTWILRDVYIDGEPFTMNGKQMRLERIEAPAVPDAEPPADDSSGDTPGADGATVINLQDMRKK